ncbi:MAG: hypothetical protein ACPGVX_02870, partial [Thalassobaculaceae bacterium]
IARRRERAISQRAAPARHLTKRDMRRARLAKMAVDKVTGGVFTHFCVIPFDRPDGRLLRYNAILCFDLKTMMINTVFFLRKMHFFAHSGAVCQ